MIGSYLFTRENIKLSKKKVMNLLLKTNKYHLSDLFTDNDKDEYTSFELLSEIVPKICFEV